MGWTICQNLLCAGKQGKHKSKGTGDMEESANLIVLLLQKMGVMARV